MKSNRKIYYRPYFFNKRLNVQFLNKKFGKHFQKVFDLKGLTNTNLGVFLKVKLSLENLREGKKQYFSKTKGLII